MGIDQSSCALGGSSSRRRSASAQCSRIQAERREPHRDFVPCEYYDALDEPDNSFATMYRDRRYKLVLYHGHNLGELYDLEEDPNEFENMWDEPEAQPLKLELMQKSFDASMQAMDRGPERVGPM